MAVVNYNTGTSATVMTTELNSITNGSRSNLGVEISNDTGKDLYGAFVLNVTFGTNPTVNSTVDLYLVPSFDGTNYMDGSSSVEPSINYYVGAFQLRATTSAQRVGVGWQNGEPIKLLPYKLKPMIINRSGQSFPASGSTLVFYPFWIEN